MKTFVEEKQKMLIVDDESLVRNFLVTVFEDRFVCQTAESAEDALQLLPRENFNLVLTDIDMREMSGIELLPHVHAHLPDAMVILISGKKDIENAISAMRFGAYDFIQKPFGPAQVEIAVERALEHHALLREKRRYENHLEELVKERTERLDYLSYYDSLTALPNRALFEDRLSQAILAARHEGKNPAIALLSIDRFKNFQDILGYEVTEQMLREFSEIVQNSVGELNTAARFEGGEFALLLNSIENPEAVIDVLTNINETIKMPLLIGGQEIFLTISVGISFLKEDEQIFKMENAASLLQKSGIALSRAVENGGNNFQFYESKMNHDFVRRLEVENNLRRALEREEFELYYQPKIETVSGKIVGAEALVRWHHPEMGIISPAEFIPLAEETGLIVPLGEWIMRTGCRQNKIWHERGFPLHLAVNLSAVQFKKMNLAKTVFRVLEETKLDPQYLELEITESCVMQNAGYAIQVLTELRQSGVKIAIDDFGTGYSSLSYLKKLPLDVLKIDKSFIGEATVNPDDASLVMAIIALAHNLRLQVVAEGVENQEQCKLLNLLRCDLWQGFLRSKPVSADEFLALL